MFSNIFVPISQSSCRFADINEVEFFFVVFRMLHKNSVGAMDLLLKYTAEKLKPAVEAPKSWEALSAYLPVVSQSSHEGL
ncbi:MAG: hypothetical protein DDT42_02091 [candidate division WS2 bacterium]|uniref:Uncharacterized protein n=1 Tax=Psychracetigena formicireducens TaxID=2986056 RepID=A0A9E2BIY1_PSYF1|nr:hypothetical protein [Candidatus Psychracetigena formicireducens]